jgi:hypothetical protein
MVRKGAVALRLPNLRKILIAIFRPAGSSVATIIVMVIGVTFIGTSL